jgi:hypothetical protein
MVSLFVLMQRSSLDRIASVFQIFRRVKKAGAMILYRTGSQPSLRVSGELNQLMASPAPGLSPAVQTVVDLPNYINSPS